ncbi:MAG: adenosine kinase [Hyphomicrobiales bacterium]|nr:adenosine kinase [Hyphomicrobiales bacterium]MDE2016201.1 adenosine kinase [Hyphomicrobiales bacterium]
MTAVKYDVLGVGNALVDVLAPADDDFLAAAGIAKGAMTLIDEDRAGALYARMARATMASGGSAANTIAGVAGFGASGAFVGKVRDDEFGDAFAHDLHAAGVTFETARATHGPSTGRSYIFVSPEGERSMNTYLGAGLGLDEGDVDEARVAASRIVYLEGYLWDPPGAKRAFRRASKVAHAAGRRVALTLSDSFCVERWRDEFLGLIRDGLVDVVFANEAETKALYRLDGFDDAFAALAKERALSVVTRGAAGCLVADAGKVVAAPAQTVAKVVDTTGAGDLFAAGFLVGLARGAPHEASAKLGAVAAAEILGHYGPRAQGDLRDLARKAGVAGV